MLCLMHVRGLWRSCFQLIRRARRELLGLFILAVLGAVIESGVFVLLPLLGAYNIGQWYAIVGILSAIDGAAINKRA